MCIRIYILVNLLRAFRENFYTKIGIIHFWKAYGEYFQKKFDSNFLDDLNDLFQGQKVKIGVLGYNTLIHTQISIQKLESYICGEFMGRIFRKSLVPIFWTTLMTFFQGQKAQNSVFRL